MANDFAIQPDLDSDFPPKLDVWVCPITGIEVPKDPDKNLAWRAEILELAEEDEELQADLYTACSQSLLFFVNAFVFTLRVFQSSGEGEAKQAADKHVPMVTWPIQDRHLLKIEDSIEIGDSLLTDKSRDMGATWDHIVTYVHRLLFCDSESHLMISRKEDAVDELTGQPKGYPHGPLANPSTLFGKVDYILSRLPEWMLPSLSRKRMHLVNLDNDTRIDGESANETAGSSDRRTSIFLDEMAKMRAGKAIKQSTADVTACRLVCSTPYGAGTAFTEWRMSGAITVFELPWWEHPEKGKDRYVEETDLGKYIIRSPWYDQEKKRRSPKELAIEVDMDHIGSGDTFFESHTIEEHKMLHGKPTHKTLAINWRKNVPDSKIPDYIRRKQYDKVYRGGSGSLRVWASLKNGRLDQTKTYVVGVDISKGQGASNSVISIKCIETGEKVAEWADASTPPYTLARIVTATCLWVGGRNGLPLLIWENNGDPGFDFGQQVVHNYRYPRVYFDRQPGTVSEKVGKRWGWRSSPEKKAIALGELRRAYAHGGYINHSLEALEECLNYVHYTDGGIGPAAFTEESASARKCHGDRVIADMLTVIATQRGKIQPVAVRPPEYSIGGRMKKWKQHKRKEERGPEKFSFA